MDGIHVFLGTKAQYVKTAPLLRLLDQRGVTYRLIDTGQHARLSAGLRVELGVRPPDHVLGGATDVDSIPQAAWWAASIARRLARPEAIRREVFGGDGGICVVHGDTPSTVLATLLARRAGLRVAHLEAGLRSHNLLHPFPEEAIRLVVMRLASLLFAPDATAVANLRALRVRGRVVPVPGNTSIDAVRAALDRPVAPGSGPAVITMHRVENLHRRRRVDELASVVERIAARWPARVVVHGPTRAVLARTGVDQRLLRAGVELVPLVPYGAFVAMVAAAPFVITDGGSVQEECALLGVPTLLWRARTERPDGLGANVVLSGYDRAVVDAFLADPERHRRPAVPLETRPSQAILTVLLDELAPARP